MGTEHVLGKGVLVTIRSMRAVSWQPPVLLPSLIFLSSTCDLS